MIINLNNILFKLKRQNYIPHRIKKAKLRLIKKLYLKKTPSRKRRIPSKMRKNKRKKKGFLLRAHI